MIDYFVGNMWLAWLIVSIGLLLLELTSGDFYVICFAFGAVASIVGAAIGLPLWAQVLIWAVCSVLFFISSDLRSSKGCMARRTNVRAMSMPSLADEVS